MEALKDAGLLSKDELFTGDILPGEGSDDE
jgi:hypothetical protein